MLEVEKTIRTDLQLIHPETGELVNVTGSTNVSKKYYSIKKLNKRICVKDLFTYQSEICRSSKDILMFRDFLLSVNKYNEFNEVISKFCKNNNIDRSRFTKFLKDTIDVGFTKRIGRGRYLVNPFVFQSIGSNNELIELAQAEWNNIEQGD